MRKRLFVFVLSFAPFVVFAAAVANGEEKSEPPRAARSVHLAYLAEDADQFYCEVKVEKSTPGSYFMVCGFSHGYFGIQELGNGKKVVLFSVWDPTKGDSPTDVPEEQRVEVPYHADDVTVRRFGGEGTGGQSFFNWDWKVSQTYRFLVRCEVTEKKTAYSAWFFAPEAGSWKHLVTFRTRTGGDRLKGLYSFIEDFRRDTKSADETRRATFTNGWINDKKTGWKPLNKARFTASSATWEARNTIDAGIVSGQFYLQTGGETKQTRPLNAILERWHEGAPPSPLPKP
jgi:hypothetical protein